MADKNLDKQKAIELSKKCCFDLKLSNSNIGDDNVSDEFIIMEHLQADDYEYRNGFLAFTLSEKKLKQMANSFKNKDRELYINYDHEPTGSTLAAGWFKEVRAGKTENGFGLFAKAKWTPKASEHIKNEEYVYFSAECQIEGMCAKWEDGEVLYDPKIKKSTINGGALTNNPFFKTTNLSLSENNENQIKDLDMEDYSKLNAEFEQLKLDSAGQIATFKSEIELKDKIISELTSQLSELKLSTRNGLISTLLAKLPEDQEKRTAVKLKLENLADKLGTGADFSEMADLIVKENDQRIVVPKVPNLNLSDANMPKDISMAEFAELQHNLQYTKKGE